MLIFSLIKGVGFPLVGFALVGFALVGFRPVVDQFLVGDLVLSLDAEILSLGGLGPRGQSIGLN